MYELITVTNDKHESFRAMVIGNVTEGETTYVVGVTEHGGIWYKGDWVTDKWHFLSEKAFTEQFPFLANRTLNNPNTLRQIKQELDSLGLLSF